MTRSLMLFALFVTTGCASAPTKPATVRKPPTWAQMAQAEAEEVDSADEATNDSMRMDFDETDANATEAAPKLRFGKSAKAARLDD